MSATKTAKVAARHLPAGSIKLRSTARGVTIRATGAAAAVLAGAVRRNIDEAPGRPYTTVQFVDDGQDVLEWDLDANQVVTDSRPYQAEVWKGAQVVGPVAPGMPLSFIASQAGGLRVCRWGVAAVIEGRRP